MVWEKSRTPIQRNTPVYARVDDYRGDLVVHLNVAYETVHRVNSESIQSRNNKINHKRRYKTIKVGDLVLIWNPNHKTRNKHKLSRGYVGPYRVLKQTLNVNYQVVNITKRKDKKVIHKDRLKVCVSRQETESIIEKPIEEVLHPNNYSFIQ